MDINLENDRVKVVYIMVIKNKTRKKDVNFVLKKKIRKVNTSRKHIRSTIPDEFNWTSELIIILCHGWHPATLLKNICRIVTTVQWLRSAGLAIWQPGFNSRGIHWPTKPFTPPGSINWQQLQSVGDHCWKFQMQKCAVVGWPECSLRSMWRDYHKVVSCSCTSF